MLDFFSLIANLFALLGASILARIDARAEDDALYFIIKPESLDMPLYRIDNHTRHSMHVQQKKVSALRHAIN